MTTSTPIGKFKNNLRTVGNSDEKGIEFYSKRFTLCLLLHLLVRVARCWLTNVFTRDSKEQNPYTISKPVIKTGENERLILVFYLI